MSFKERDRQLLEWYRRQIKKLGIEVKLNTEITDLKQIKADEIVIATGATAKKLKIKGVEKVIDAIDFLNNPEQVKENIVVIGGGLTGCEIAYQLALDGKKPVIVETKNDLMAVKGLCLANSSYLRDYFKHNDIPVYLESFVSEIGKNYVIIMDKNGKQTKVDADNVIMAVGYNPAPLAKQSRHVHVVGDALKVGNLRTVIWRAWDVATKI